MTPGASTEGTVLATGALAASEIRQPIREALEDKYADYPVPGHPPMRPEEDLGSARGAPQESARSAPQRSSEPVPTVVQEPARGAPQESVRSAPRRSTEPAPAVAPETQEQRSGDKRPLLDAPESASGSEAKRARRPCSWGTAVPRGLVLQLAPKKALRVSSASTGRTVVPPAASGGIPGAIACPTAEAAPSVAPQGTQAGEVIDLDADEVEGLGATGIGTDVPAAATGTTAVTEEGVSASAAAAEGAAVTEAGTSAPEVPAEVAPEAEVPARGAPAGAEELASAVAAEG
nr:fibrous sheath CABYR-binding protein-like [Setaria viridis]